MERVPAVGSGPERASQGTTTGGVPKMAGESTMAADADPGSPGDPRVYLAAERTLLAWVRTGLAMMGFGFVVARFGLFLREFAAVRGTPPPRPQGLSLWFGVALVALGVVVSLLAAAGHWRTVRRLEQGRPLRFSPLSLGTFVAVLLGVIGLLMGFYLLIGVADAS